jgi:hypothetical protein
MMKVADGLKSRLNVVSCAAIALFTGTVGFAQEHHTGAQSAPNARLLTDPAEVAALLARCGIKRAAPGGATAAPPPAGQKLTQVRAVRCELSKEMKTFGGAKPK